MKKFIFLVLILIGFQSYAKDPGPIDRINPEVSARFHKSDEEFPFFKVDEVKLKTTGTVPVEFAVVEIKAVFDAQRCINTARPKEYFVTTKNVADGVLEVLIYGLHDDTKDAAIYGICAVVSSPTYIKFEIQVNHEGPFAPDQLKLLFKDEDGKIVKESVVKYNGGKWLIL